MEKLSSPNYPVRFHPAALLAYFILSFSGFWIATRLSSISPALPLILGALIPGLVALVVATVDEGQPGVKDLVRRLWIFHVPAKWYAFAIGIPLVGTTIIWLIAGVGGSSANPQFSVISPLLLVIYFVAFTEELGWRGYALPRLLPRMPAVLAGLLFGLVHAFYHLPLWVAKDMPVPLYAFSTFLVTSLAWGVIWVWLFNGSKESVLIASLFHGTINLAGNIFFTGIPTSQLNWLLPVPYLLFACFILIRTRLALK